MPNNITARKDGAWLVISMVADVCKTPVGSAVVPIPYPIIAQCGSATKEVPHVRANSTPLITLASYIPTTTGDQPGVQKGIKSSTVGGTASFRGGQHSSTVNADKQRILRHGDMFWMNGKASGLAPNKPVQHNQETIDKMNEVASPTAPSAADVALAKTEGTSPEHVAAREKVARDYLKKNDFSESQITEALGSKDDSRIGGVDLKKPVEVISFPPPEHMSQHVKSHGFPGNWFDPKGTQSPDSLGISGEGRTLKNFVMPKASGLQSHSKPIVDNWTNPKNPISTSGGGAQLFVNEATKKQVISMNKVGI